MKLGLALLIALALAGAVGASRPQRQASAVEALSLTITAGTKTVSGNPVPDTASCWTSFNGNSPQAAWADSAHILEYAWHGVIAVISASDSALTLKVASVPRDSVYVYARCSW